MAPGLAKAFSPVDSLAAGRRTVLKSWPENEVVDVIRPGSTHTIEECMQAVSAGQDSVKRQFALTAGALGVVFGDIGTSPLYALKECFQIGRAHV